VAKTAGPGASPVRGNNGRPFCFILVYSVSPHMESSGSLRLVTCSEMFVRAMDRDDSGCLAPIVAARLHSFVHRRVKPLRNLCLSLLLVTAAAGDEPKRLLIHSSGRDFARFNRRGVNILFTIGGEINTDPLSMLLSSRGRPSLGTAARADSNLGSLGG
jgi:hypothetical protein